MMKIKKASKLAKLSAVALLLSTSIVVAQEAPASTTETAPVAAPEAPVPAPAQVVAPAPAPAPVVVAVAEAAPAKPAETVSATVAGTKISLYGRLELNTAYETDVTNGLWSANAPSGAKGDAQGRTSLSIARTRLGFNLEGPSKDDEPSLKGRFEADFAGNSSYSNFNGTSGSNSGFRIRQSYGSVSFKDLGLTLLFGQTDDVVTPLDPPSVNPSSYNGAGNIGNRRPQIRVTEAIGPVEVAVAATHDRTYGYTARIDKDKADPDRAAIKGSDGSDSIPAYKGTDKAVTDADAPTIPAFQGRVGVKLPASWAGEKASLVLGLGGLFAKNEVANLDDKNRYASPEPSYMFGADLSLPIIDILTLTGEFFTGQNLSRYGDGSLGQKRAYSDDGGIKSIGWWGGLAAKLPASLSAGAGVGAESLDDKSKSNGNAESNMFIFANLAYNFTSAAKATFEYVNFSTDYSVFKNGKYDSSDNRSLNRFELNFRYDFK
ncbi:MAG: hypothetical protein LBC87_08320 [Fibromonadaceae bacterium]|jgi:hypothetical protein|nr:hypothetical protein [Fibromonadaceae bacterium]